MAAQRGGTGGRPAHEVVRIVALVLGALDILFLSVFALDAFAPGVPLGEQLIGFGMHLIPSIVFVALIATAWRFRIAGGAALILAAAAPFVALSNPFWVNLILSLPVLAVGSLFVLSAWLRSRTHRAA